MPLEASAMLIYNAIVAASQLRDNTKHEALHVQSRFSASLEHLLVVGGTLAKVPIKLFSAQPLQLRMVCSNCWL